MKLNTPTHVLVYFPNGHTPSLKTMVFVEFWWVQPTTQQLNNAMLLSLKYDPARNPEWYACLKMSVLQQTALPNPEPKEFRFRE